MSENDGEGVRKVVGGEMRQGLVHVLIMALSAELTAERLIPVKMLQP